MKKANFIFAVVISLLSCSLALAQEERVVAKKPLIPPAYPSYSIQETIYDGAIEEENAQIQVKYRINVLGERPAKVPILPKDVAVTKTHLPKDVLLVVQDDWYNLLFTKKGNYSVTVDFTSRIYKKEDKNVLAFKSPASAISKLTLLIPGTGLDIETSPPISMHTKEISNRDTQLTAFLGATQSLQIKWSFKPSALIAVEPVFLSESNMLVVISPGIISTSSAIYYKIMQGKLSSFKVNLPLDVNLLTVKGENLKSWDIKTDREGQLLEIELSKEITDHYKLVLEMEEIKEEVAGPYEIAEISTQDAKRQTGHIAVVTKGNLEVRPTQKTGISQIDSNLLPEELRRMARGEISLAYKYLRQPVALSLDIKKITPEVTVRNNLFLQVDEELTKLYMLLDYDIQKAGIFNLALDLPQELNITDVTGNDIETWTVTKKGTLQTLEVQLKNETLGKYQLLVKTEKPVRDIKNILKGIEVPKVNIQNVKKVIGYIGISSVSNIRFSTADKESLTEIDIEELISPPKGIDIQPTLAYKYIEQIYELRLAAEEVEPRVTSDVFTFLSVGEGLLLVNSAINYNIQYAGVDEFTLTFPEDVNAIEITGRNIKSKKESIREKKEDGKKVKEKIWKVNLHSKAKGAYTLYCSYEKLMEDTSGKVDLPTLQVLNTEREIGYYCLGPRTNVEIKLDIASGASQIDVKELPQDKVRSIDIPLALAFKYVRHPYAISVNIKKHEDVSVLVAIAESAEITTVLTKEGQIIVDAFYNIKNKQKQYLDISLPKDANIWSTFVNNKPVKAGKIKEGHILIPLERSRDKETVFPVEIVYETKGPSLKLFGTLGMTQPQVDIPITNVSWRLFLPKGFGYFRFKGNLEMVKAKERAVSIGGLPRLRPEEPRPVRPYLPADQFDEKMGRGPILQFEGADEKGGLRGLRRKRRAESIEEDKDFISSIKSQVQVYQQRMEPQPKKVEKGKSVGVLPIKVVIPTGGTLYTFGKLFSSGELLNINALYVKGLQKIFWGLIVVIGVIVFMYRKNIKVFLAKRRQPKEKTES